MVAWLNPKEAQSANWLIEQTQPVVIAEEGENSYAYQISEFSRKIEPVVTDGEISFLVQIKTQGMVMKKTGTDIDFSKPSNLKKMEQLFAATIKRQADSAIDKSQNEIEADYLGFSKAFQQHHPETFKSLNWGEVYPTVPIQVEVSCKVKGYGLRS